MWKNFCEILTHKFFEKWNFRKKTPKTAFFSLQLEFLKIYELNSFQNVLVQSPGIVTQKSEIWWKSVRWISRSRYVLLTHNWKRIFANPCEISNVPLRKFFRFLKIVPQYLGIILANFWKFLWSFGRERIFLLKNRFWKMDSGFTTLRFQFF